MKPFVLQSLVILALALLLPTPAGAQTPGASYLKGLHSFDIVVEEVRSNLCDITTDDVKTSTQYILTQSRIKFETKSTTYIYVNVDVFDDCTTANVQVSVRSQVTVLTTSQYAVGSIWDNAILLGGSNMHQRVMDSVEELMKKLVVDWSSVNP